MGRGGTWGPTGTRERTSEANWRKPIRWNKLAGEGRLPDGSANPDGHRPRIFCASLADVFEPRPELVPWRLDLFALIEATPNLDWLLLTKRPEVARDALREWHALRGPIPGSGALFADVDWTSRDGVGWGILPNIWLGISIEDSRYTWRADVLREIPAAVRFISAEPLIGSLFDPAPGLRLGKPRASVWSGRWDGLELDVVDAKISVASNLPAPNADHGLASGTEASEEEPGRARRAPLDLSGIDWVIIGGESGGPKSRPMHPAWAREIRDAILDRCRACDFEGDELCSDPRPALYLKQWGSWSPAGIGDVTNTRLSVGLLESGRQVTVAEAAETPGGEIMVYRGPRPTSGGKHFDGATYCEFPRSLVAA